MYMLKNNGIFNKSLILLFFIDNIVLLTINNLVLLKVDQWLCNYLKLGKCGQNLWNQEAKFISFILIRPKLLIK